MQAQPRFIADEGFDKEIVLALREAYDVQYVLEMERCCLVQIGGISGAGENWISEIGY